jgi:LysM repeat protein
MSDSGVYVVRPGDTVRSVATSLGVPAMELCRVNGLRPGDQLKPGQKLRLPRLQKVEPTQNLWQGGDKTPAQGFDSLRHMQTQLIQLPKFGQPKKPDSKPEPPPALTHEDPNDKAQATALQAKMAKKKRLFDKEAQEAKPGAREQRLSQEAAFQAKRLSDKLSDSGEIKLINPFGDAPGSAKRNEPFEAFEVFEAPELAEPPEPAAPAASAQQEAPPPPPPEPGDATDPLIAGKKETPASTRLFARRRQKSLLSGNTETLKKMSLADQGQGREATRIISLSDVSAALEGGDAFKHLDETSVSAKAGQDQFKSLSSRGGASGGVPDSFKMAGSGGAARDSTDRFSAGKKGLADSDGDVFRRYRTSEAEDGQASADGETEELETASEDAPLRKDQIRIGERRLALPSSLLTQSLGDPGRTDPIFANALEGAIEPGRTARVELGPGLTGPEPSLRELEGLECKPERIEILRSKDNRYLTQLALRGSSTRWPELAFSETYQFNPDNPDDLTRMFMLLSRPQPVEFLEKLRVVRREFDLGPIPPSRDACLAFGLQTARGSFGPRSLARWLEVLAPQDGAVRAWEEARSDVFGMVHLLPVGNALDKAVAGPFAQISLAQPGPSALQAVWHALIARSWTSGRAAFLDELAGPFPPEERMLAIGWAHLSSGTPKIEMRLVLSESWANRIQLPPPLQAPPNTRIELCWSAGSPKWTQRPKAVEALWKTLEGSVAPAELQLAETFAASFFKQSTLTLTQHAVTRKAFADFSRALLAENRIKGEAAGQAQGRPPSQLWTRL